MAKVPTDASVTSGPGSACRSLDAHGIFWGHFFLLRNWNYLGQLYSRKACSVFLPSHIKKYGNLLGRKLIFAISKFSFPETMALRVFSARVQVGETV